MESVFDTLEREVVFDRTRDLNLPPASSSVPVSRHLYYDIYKFYFSHPLYSIPIKSPHCLSAYK